MCTKIVAILGIVFLEAIALLTNTDGVLLVPIVAVIAGLAGYEFKIYRNREGDNELYTLPEELKE